MTLVGMGVGVSIVSPSPNFVLADLLKKHASFSHDVVFKSEIPKICLSANQDFMQILPLYKYSPFLLPFFPTSPLSIFPPLSFPWLKLLPSQFSSF